MNQLQLAASLCIGAALLPFTTIAHVPQKDAAISIALHDWTGFYAGLNAGTVKHTMNITDLKAASFNATIQQVSNPKFAGGFQVGLRRQLDTTKASGVYGLEFSAHFADAKFEQQYGSPFALYQLNSQSRLKNVNLMQFIGGIAADKTLLFLAAGLSWVHITGGVKNVDGLPFFDSFSISKKTVSTALGGGIEYAVTDKISARLKVDITTPNTFTTTDNVDNVYQASNSVVLGTFGVNYKFG